MSKIPPTPRPPLPASPSSSSSVSSYTPSTPSPNASVGEKTPLLPARTLVVGRDQRSRLLSHHSYPAPPPRLVRPFQFAFLALSLYLLLAPFLGLPVWPFTHHSPAAPATSPHPLSVSTHRPALSNTPTQLLALPSTHIPSATNPDARLIFIGDVHGMYPELQHLLSKLSYTPGRDHLVLTGDMITKGPRNGSLKTLSFLRAANASCVRGNHDDRVLLHYAAQHTRTLHARQIPANASVSAAERKVLAEQRLAREMSAADAAWLQECPLILTAADVPGLGDVAVVHAGLLAGVELDRQDPRWVMNMRSVGRGGVPRAASGGRHWAGVWNRAMARVREGRRTVVYGHYAARGLDIRRYTKGLDSGCAAGGRLSAMVVTAGGKPRIVDVKCRRKA